MALRSYLVGEVVEDFDDGLMTRREALRRLVLLGVGASAATGLLAACSGDDDRGARSTTTAPPAGEAAAVEDVAFRSGAVEVTGVYVAADDQKGAVLVVHENRGLTPHFRALVARLAADGYSALCVDLLSRKGGTAKLDEAEAQAALAAAPMEELVGDLVAGIDELGRRAVGASVGAVGFCFGGAMVWNLLQRGEPRLAAAAPFYGPAPDPADFTRSKAAVLAVFAELDARVNASRDRAAAALAAAGLTHEVRTFPGVDHAFFNDTGPRYDAKAASEAYGALLAWFGRHLT